jgi:ribosomal protein S18 acetylase RimI-like enzyme
MPASSPVHAVSHTTVQPIQDTERLRAFLIRDPVKAAYHLGDLDPRFAGFCQWFGVDNTAGELDALLLLYTGLRTPAVLTLGSDAGVEALLDDEAVQKALPPRFYAHVMKPHVGALVPNYQVDGMRQMLRMELARDAFAPTEAGDGGLVDVSHADTADLMKLYHFYPDNFFEPYQLEGGLYVGLRTAEGLVSVAGTHLVSQAQDIAVLGNIVTHPDHRAKGFSTRCTLKLLRRLFEQVSLVALNVEDKNHVAQRVYERLGFSVHMRYLEGLVVAR